MNALGGESKALVRKVVWEAAVFGSADTLRIMRHLFQMAEIVVSDEVETARICVSVGRPVVSVGRQFLREILRSPGDLLHAVAHELGHHLMGDLGDRPPAEVRPDVAAAIGNLVADLHLNAHLRVQALPYPPQYHRRLYRDGDTLVRMLCDPEWLIGSVPAHRRFRAVRQRLREGFETLMRQCGARQPYRVKAEWFRELARAYEAAWFKKASKAVLFARIGRVVAQMADANGIVLEPKRGCGHREASDAALRQFLRRVRWRDLPPSDRCGDGGEEVEANVGRRPVPRACWEFCEAVRRALTFHPQARSAVRAPERGVVAFPGRRELLWLALGVTPSSYPNPEWREDFCEEGVRLYVDVSGSMGALVELAFSLALHLGGLVGRVVYGFSTTVTELTLNMLRAGRFQTTGGTDYEAMLQDAVRRGFRRILVVTDGYGSVGKATVQSVLSAGLTVFVVFVRLPNVLLGDDWEEILGGPGGEGYRYWILPRALVREWFGEQRLWAPPRFGA
jgi:hypothetical protein